VQYQFYPAPVPSSVSSASSTNIIDVNHNEIYTVLVNKFVRQRKASEIQQDSSSSFASTNSVKSTSLFLSESASWILDEYSNLFGINELFAQLALLKSIISMKTSLVIPLAKQINDTITFLYKNVKRLAASEQQLFDIISMQFQAKLLKLACDYVKYFPENQPKGALESVLEIIAVLRSSNSVQADDLQMITNMLAADAIRVRLFKKKRKKQTFHSNIFSL